MKILIIARNIVNQDEISKFLETLIEDSRIEKPQIISWIRKQLKNFIQNEYSGVKKVRESKEEYPDWMKKSIEEGTALQVDLDNIDFINDCGEIIDYFNSLNDEELNKISKIPFLVARSKSNEWLEELIKKGETEEDSDGIEVVRKYKDGFSWVKVFSQKSLNREGFLMRHCVGSYYEKVTKDDCLIYSLRNEKNIPKCTVEIIKQTVNQIKGFANGPIQTKYVKYVENFIKKPVGGNSYKTVKDLLNIGILIQDRVWYNIYNLPDNFVVKKDLTFRNNTYPIKLPKNLTVNNLKFRHCKEKIILPENLIVHKGLLFHNCNTVLMPKTLISKSMDIYNTHVDFKDSTSVIIQKYFGIANALNRTIKLTKNVSIEGELYLDDEESSISIEKGCKIKTIVSYGGLHLPDDYTCSYLCAVNTFELPKNLTVDELVIQYDSITRELPRGLIVNKKLILEKPIHYQPDIIVKGSVILQFKQERPVKKGKLVPVYVYETNSHDYMNPKPKGVRRVLRK